MLPPFGRHLILGVYDANVYTKSQVLGKSAHNTYQGFSALPQISAAFITMKNTKTNIHQPTYSFWWSSGLLQ